jgi:endonuclease/exonuclease/phosphatase family metal-dependent hydrolase
MFTRRRWPLRLPLFVPFLFLGLAGCPGFTSSPAASNGPSDSYLFCFWNVENLFDDHLDGRVNKADKEFDTWFAEDAKSRRLKYEHLRDALLQLNDGKGPDILALAEVETLRAAELLREALNDKLDPALHYTHVLFKEANGGRNINTAILARVPVEGERTKLLGRRLRILEGHLVVNGHELVVIASHWTSRVTDEGGEGRDKYGDQIYGAYKAMHRANPKIDLLVCGDFNDPPDEISVVKHLHAVEDGDAVRKSGNEPLLLDLMAGKAPREFGTLYESRQAKWYIFDQIVVSPGLLDDDGWSCDPDSVHTVNGYTAQKNGHPKSFGSERRGERGYSDHFPVTVRLKVQGR